MRLPFKYRPSFAVGALMLTWGIAAVFGLLTLLGRWEEQSFLRDSVAATGEVRAVRVRVKLDDDKDRSSHRTEHYRPLVVFLAGDHEVEFEGRNETLDENKWQVGQRVDVRYRTTDPADARIDTPEELHASEQGMWTGAIISFAAGIVVVVVAKLSARFESRKRASSGEDARRAHFGERD